MNGSYTNLDVSEGEKAKMYTYATSLLIIMTIVYY
jgi:hypothetical protein